MKQVANRWSTNPIPQQAVLAMAYLLTSQGIPCIYYGTEQGFDGGGPDDSYVRECMFGGEWGAFNSTGQHFFNPQHEIYRGISAVARLHACAPNSRHYVTAGSTSGKFQVTVLILAIPLTDVAPWLIRASWIQRKCWSP